MASQTSDEIIDAEGSDTVERIQASIRDLQAEYEQGHKEHMQIITNMENRMSLLQMNQGQLKTEQDILEKSQEINEGTMTTLREELQKIKIDNSTSNHDQNQCLRNQSDKVKNIERRIQDMEDVNKQMQKSITKDREDAISVIHAISQRLNHVENKIGDGEVRVSTMGSKMKAMTRRVKYGMNIIKGIQQQILPHDQLHQVRHTSHDQQHRVQHAPHDQQHQTQHTPHDQQYQIQHTSHDQQHQQRRQDQQQHEQQHQDQPSSHDQQHQQALEDQLPHQHQHMQHQQRQHELQQLQQQHQQRAAATAAAAPAVLWDYRPGVPCAATGISAIPGEGTPANLTSRTMGSILGPTPGQRRAAAAQQQQHQETQHQHQHQHQYQEQHQHYRQSQQYNVNYHYGITWTKRENSTYEFGLPPTTTYRNTEDTSTGNEVYNSATDNPRHGTTEDPWTHDDPWSQRRHNYYSNARPQFANNRVPREHAIEPAATHDKSNAASEPTKDRRLTDRKHVPKPTVFEGRKEDFFQWSREVLRYATVNLRDARKLLDLVRKNRRKRESESEGH